MRIAKSVRLPQDLMCRLRTFQHILLTECCLINYYNGKTARSFVLGFPIIYFIC